MRTNNIVVLASEESGIYPENLFKFAYHYYEVRVSKEYIVQRFLDWHYRNVLPTTVLDYCLEILSHRIVVQK